MAGSTHTVTNQAPPLVGHDVFTADRALTDAVGRHLAPQLREEAFAELSGLGRGCGSLQTQEWGAQANANPRCCARTTGTATGSTRWTSTPPGTGCWARAWRRA